MSAITILKIENEFLCLEENIKKLKLLNSPLIFRIIISESIKLLSLISQQIKTKDNLFGKNIAKELLIEIVSFLPFEYISICKNVCINWNKDIKNCLSKKILLPIPKNISYCETFKLDFSPRSMAKIVNDIYITNRSNATIINIQNSRLIRENNENFHNIISSNKNYVCIKYPEEIMIFSPDMQFIGCILISTIQGLAIDNNNHVLVSTCDKFHIFDIKGRLINSWNLINNSLENQRSRKISFNKNEIFIIDTAFNSVCVFSNNGELIRSWGNLGNGPGEFLNPWGIDIYRDTVFVVDSGNKRIQAFTCNGDFIFEYVHKDAIDISDILISNNYVYISDWENTSITKFKIIYQLKN